MARRVRWTESAWNDVEATADYIARDSRRYAAVFVREARGAARALRQFARRGRIVPELGDESIREIFVYSHRLIYRVTEDAVEIPAGVHGARDLKRLWERQRP